MGSIAATLAYFGQAENDPLLLLGAGILLTLAAQLSRSHFASLLALFAGLAAVAAGLVRATAIDFLPDEWIVLCLAALVPVAACSLVVVLARWRRLAGWIALVPATAAIVLALVAPVNSTHPVIKRSQYVEMDDGVRLAVDHYLPRGWAGEPLPAIMVFTRYHRATAYNFPFNLLLYTGSGNRERLAEAGYASVVVDVRGTGASFGSRATELGKREIDDFPQVVDWVIAQPWSNGAVGAEGVSYSGSAAELLMLQRHPAVKAVSVHFSLFDAYDDPAFPDGLENLNITDAWGGMLRALDENRLPPGMPGIAGWAWAGVPPVDVPGGEDLLVQAIAEHRSNYDARDYLETTQFRDETWDGQSPFAGAPMFYLESYKDLPAPTLIVSGWLDGGYSGAAIKRLVNVDHPDLKVILGPWNHGPSAIIDPCDTGELALGRRSDLTIPFYDHYIKSRANDYDDVPRLRYYQSCGAGWLASDTWPPSERSMDFYLTENGLEAEQAALPGLRRYTADPTATTGPGSRWSALFQLPGVPEQTGYPDRKEQDGKLILFDSSPLSEPLAIAGNPLAQITLSADGPDGALIAYLEEVTASGEVRYITEGGLRLSHRKVFEDAPYFDLGPVRTHARGDAQPMPVGEKVSVTLGMQPIAYRLARGSRLRLALAAADAGNFRPVPGQAETYRFHFGPGSPARIVIPLERPDPLLWDFGKRSPRRVVATGSN